MFRFVDLLKLAQDIECEPYVFRIGCVQCIRALTQTLETPERLAKTHQTGAPTNVDCDNLNHTWFVQACLKRPDTETGVRGWGFGGKIMVSSIMSKGEIGKKFFVAARDYAEHEVREGFLYRGRRVLGPHIDIDTLWEVAEDTEARA